jgi:hypothetical protein
VKIPAADPWEHNEQTHPTDSADLQVTVRNVASGKASLPGRFTGHLLDAVTLGFGIAGMGYGAVAILGSGASTLNPGILLTLCAMYVIVVGGLTWAVIRRHWQDGRS